MLATEPVVDLVFVFITRFSFTLGGWLRNVILTISLCFEGRRRGVLLRDELQIRVPDSPGGQRSVRRVRGICPAEIRGRTDVRTAGDAGVAAVGVRQEELLVRGPASATSVAHEEVEDILQWGLDVGLKLNLFIDC